MRCTRLSIICIYLLLVMFSANAQDYRTLQKEVDKLVYLDARVNFERTPGFVMGVLWGDSTYYFSYGSIAPDTTLAPDSLSLYEIGEAGHILLAELVQREIDAGRRQADSPLTAPFPQREEITLAQLLTHYSGLPRFLPDFGNLQSDTDDPYAGITWDQLHAFLEDADEKPGDYIFSNLNYAVLGYLLTGDTSDVGGALTGRLQQAFPDMEHTVCRVVADSALVPGFDKAGQPTPPWGASALQPAIGFKSTAVDLCTFIRHLLGARRFSEIMEDTRKTGIRHNTRVARGWHVLQLKKYYPIFVQSGATSGYRAYVAVVPETQTGVVVLSNSPFGLNGIGFMTLRMLNNYWKK